MKFNFTSTTNLYILLIKYFKMIPIKLYNESNQTICNINKYQELFEAISHLGKLYPSGSIEELYFLCVEYAKNPAKVNIFDSKNKLDVAVGLFLSKFYVEFNNQSVHTISINDIENVIIRSILIEYCNIYPDDSEKLYECISYNIFENLNLISVYKNTEQMSWKLKIKMFYHILFNGCSILDNIDENGFEIITQKYNDYKSFFSIIKMASILYPNLRFICKCTQFII